MSLRRIGGFFVQNGRRILFQSIGNREFCYVQTQTRTYFHKIQLVRVGKSQGQEPQGQSAGYTVSTGRLSYLANARRLFVDSILKRVTNTLAADLRRRAAKQLSYGDSAPFFALVGVSLASGTGILTKDDELEGVCYEIRDAVSKVQWNNPQNDRNCEAIVDNKSLSLQNFEIGSLIAKGCSGVVYTARVKTDDKEEEGKESLKDKTFPLVIKMMFNYNAESNTFSILKAMHRETVPARKCLLNADDEDFENEMMKTIRMLPPHPNIVAMYYVFADRIQALPGSLTMYPDALPTRLNPNGSGRNMSLFLVMKRYDTTLREYLKRKSNTRDNMRESILLLAQLLEGVAHMNFHGIAHRDLKSDNILLDISEEKDNCASLVITDFGCCLADKSSGLYMPYNTYHVERPGNAALMAPEVVNVKPGAFTSINYTKADLWTVGTIAYEIFGLPNPFYSDSQEKAGLSNKSYKNEDLPPLPENVPPIVAALVKNILNRNIYKRLNAQIAATVMQLQLWAPNSWFQKNMKLPSNNEIMQWLLCLTTKVLCEGRIINANSLQTSSKEKKINEHRSLSVRSGGRRTMPEYQLIASFLNRVTLSNVRESLTWIQRNVSISLAECANLKRIEKVEL